MKMILREHIYELIDTNKIRLQLALAMNVGETTIRNYLRVHSEQLTLAAALKVISRETGIPENELITEDITA